MNMIAPLPGFLEGLRDLCDDYGSVFIVDEVMTGFRVAKGGAQDLFGITPDLTTLGKIVGGGMPAAAFGGRAEVMASIAPDGPVYQAGTLSGNPVAMAAGLATLEEIDKPAFEDVVNRGFLENSDSERISRYTDAWEAMTLDVAASRLDREQTTKRLRKLLHAPT